jgi:DNA polymerase III epsilon subunit-like protein
VWQQLSSYKNQLTNNKAAGFWRGYGKFAWIAAFAPIDIAVSENKTAAVMANVADFATAYALRNKRGALPFIAPLAAYIAGRGLGYAITGKGPSEQEGAGVKAAIANVISGNDDAYNTIEGLSHRGIAGILRSQNTDFGSGYKGDETSGSITRTMIGGALLGAGGGFELHSYIFRDRFKIGDLKKYPELAKLRAIGKKHGFKTLDMDQPTPAKMKGYKGVLWNFMTYPTDKEFASFSANRPANVVNFGSWSLGADKWHTVEYYRKKGMGAMHPKTYEIADFLDPSKYPKIAKKYWVTDQIKAGDFIPFEHSQNFLKKIGGAENLILKKTKSALQEGVWIGLKNVPADEWEKAVLNTEDYLIQQKLPLKAEFRSVTVGGKSIYEAHRFGSRELQNILDTASGLAPSTIKKLKEKHYHENIQPIYNKELRQRVSAFAEKAHAVLPSNIGITAWDIGLTEQNELKIIEMQRGFGTIKHPVVFERIKQAITGKPSKWASAKQLTKIGVGAGAILGGIGYIGLGLFSGKDDAHNTIEGLPHRGMAGAARKRTTDFGSGYQGPRSAALLSDTLFSVFDLETTGLPVSGNPVGVTEIGVQKLRAGRALKRGKWSSLMRPDVPMGFEAIAKTGITEAMLKNQMSSSVGMSEFLKRTKGTVLTGHNIFTFDLPVLSEATGRAGISMGSTLAIDTLALSRAVIPTGRHSLEFLAEAGYTKFSTTAHRAMADVGANTRLFQNIVRKSGVKTFGEFASLYPEAVGTFEGGKLTPISISETPQETLSRLERRRGISTELQRQAQMARKGFIPAGFMPIQSKFQKELLSKAGAAVEGSAVTGATRVKIGKWGWGGLIGLSAISLMASGNITSNKFSGFDDEYNTIQGLGHRGIASDLRKQTTDFGSGWQGLRSFLVPSMGRKAVHKLLSTGSAEEIFKKTFGIYRKQLGGKLRKSKVFKGGLGQGINTFDPTLYVKQEEFNLIGQAFKTGKFTPKAYEAMRSTMHEIMEVHTKTTLRFGEKGAQQIYKAGIAGRAEALSSVSGKTVSQMWGGHLGKIPVEVELAFAARAGDEVFRATMAMREIELATKVPKVIGNLKEGIPYAAGESAALTEMRLKGTQKYAEELPDLLKEHEKLYKMGAFKRRQAQELLHADAVQQPFKQFQNRNGSKGVHTPTRKRKY